MNTAMAQKCAGTAKSRLMVCTFFLTVAVMVILFSATCFGKSVVIDMDGEQEEVFVYGKNVDDVLKKADIELKKEDKISANRYDETYNGQVLHVDRAIPVEFEVNGTTTQFLTTAATVGDFLDENGVVLGEFDLVTPSLDTTLTKDCCIVLAKAETEVVILSEDVPYESVSVENNRLEKGTERVKTEGENGVKEIYYHRIWRNGEVIHEVQVDEIVVKAPVNRVVEYGTYVPPIGYRGSIDRASLEGARMISMNASAYDLSYESCGKRPGDRGYGITASGMRAQRGVVAVDPKVIPLGTKLYIESADGSFVYGYAVAGDTGGAIKGNRIDLFMDSYSECMQFGRRKVNVYIIG